MNLLMRACAVVSGFALLGCATGGLSKPESTTAPGADLAAYRSFGWQSASGGPTPPDQPLSIRDANIQKAIRAQLVEKGYREDAETPDLRISFEEAAYLKEKTTSPVRIGIGVGSWGGNVGGGVGASVPVGSEGVTTTKESRLSIRAVDPNNNAEVWVGSVTGEIEHGLDAAAVDEAVASLLEGFPARRR
jgi:hypothetical protein